ncbi:UDP-N-acetylmuramoyl-tripeptide--D-alanyl-D-alanine ligase [Bacteroides faecichinchillae]|uniref:UDP-N-acetylmuramoyl-tripeptide--D-alanyl-D-alanine ligase n=1 Tax=Bacteroides faecichinchillae TaxID=871325 RepID=A0A1M4U962_9BACE|nr:UDP-N-acetylmuramoyl-tripeptide--D-alanyl-D-alanine ligase [Bacteroides faecichinchillae]THG69751.1 UDP-N-acetylmuramoyl-tripeptide--D-alanyl-D-alanine ligase [Bacteroides faecichinchillae]SHE53279.1 UDP-N-acetylmuramoyl-tripeptide--D-alanyl-D-alanine ligase [Bacteroides faecichinchillae]
MKLSALYQIFLDCQSVTTDSRNCPKGSLFIALKGESFNGNAFAGKALETGCAFAVIDEDEFVVKDDERYILVDDCLQTLQQLANYHRRQLGTRVIGITGTNGKTTTKELISAVLSQSYKILYTLGNLNNHIGVPLTLLRLKAEHDLAVIEMGASHPGDIKELVDIAEPDYGLITNVGKAHLEGFGSFEGVIKTKGELYDFLREKEASTIFIHHDNPYLMKIAYGLKQITYGSQEGLYVNGHVTGNSPYLAFEWKAGQEGVRHEVETQLIGEYNFPNALAAITIGYFFGVEPEKIDKALTEYTPQNNRSQLKKTENNTLIIDAYNANPTSMMAALENFRNMTISHKMLILGDMRELGAEGPAEHQRIVDYIKKCNFEKVWLVGDQFTAAQHSFKTYANAGEVIEEIKNKEPNGYTILIKGSNGIKLNTVVDYL